MGTQRKGTVRTHKRKVNGKTQTVKAHSRKLQPGRARANVRRAGQHRRRGSYGAAAACVGIAAAEIGGWVLLRGSGVALVTVGIAALGIGVAARRATPSTPKPTYRSTGTVRRVPSGNWAANPPMQSFYEQGLRAAQADGRSDKGYDHSIPTPKFKGEDDPDAADWNRGYEDGMR